METAARHLHSNQLHLREITEEDEDDRDHRSSRPSRSRPALHLPSISRPDLEGDLRTKKSQPFSWYRAEQGELPSLDSANVPTSYYQPNLASDSTSRSSNKYYKSSSASRVHTEVYRSKQTTSTHHKQPSRTLDQANYSKINYADRLEREMYAKPIQVLKHNPERIKGHRAPYNRNSGQYYKLAHKQRAKPRPNTITEYDEEDETSSVNSRQYLTDQPLTFGIFPHEEDEKEQNLSSTLPYEEIMHRLYLIIPAVAEHRREESVREIAYRLYKTNPLFLKMEYLTCVEMICSCTVYSLERERILFEPTQQLSASYIILWGSVQIFTEDGILQGFYEAGATLCEEYLLIGTPRKIGERARAGKRGCGVLELSHNSLKAIKQNLTRIQLKKDLVMLESVFKKNFFSKKSIRNSFKYRTGSEG